MKFRLSNLLMLTALVAVVLACILIVRNERQINEEKLNKANLAAQEAILREKVAIEEAAYCKRELGLLDADVDRTKPYIRFVPLPKELGGSQSYGRPFTWRWRLHLPDINEFEVCIAVENIPKQGFEIPAESVFATYPNLLKAGRVDQFEFPKPIDTRNPFDVFLTIRLDCEGELGKVHYCFEFEQEGSKFEYSDFVQFNSSKSNFIRDSTVTAYSNSIRGLSVNPPFDIPMLETVFSNQSPLTLVRIRSQPFVKGRIERVEGPTEGFMAWLQKRSQLSKRKLPTPDSVQQLPVKLTSVK